MAHKLNKISIPEHVAKSIADFSATCANTARYIEKYILSGMMDFPKDFLDEKILGTVISVSGAPDASSITCISLYRKDKNNTVDTDLIGILNINTHSPTLSAGYIKHDKWHETRTQPEQQFNEFFRSLKESDYLDLSAAPEAIKAAQLRVNNFLRSESELSSAHISNKNMKKPPFSI